MEQPRRIVIVGAGTAGATAAATVRELGYDGDVLLLGAEQHRPYELPALSKGVLLSDRDEPDWLHDENFYLRNDIDLRRGVDVTRLELGARVVTDAHGAEHSFDRLLLATGSRPRRLDVSGAGLSGIHTLRTIDDALNLRSAIEAGRHVVVVGAGWLGCEAAAAARMHGAEVTVVAPQPAPLRDVFGATIAEVFTELHAEHGVRWRLGTGITGFVGDGRVSGVTLTDGSVLDADVVLLAVGAQPRAELARAAGLEGADDGAVDVDAGLRTAAPSVYAAGDVAAQFHPGYGQRVRVEHWANAKQQGEHVAANLLGERLPYTAAPFVCTEQYGAGCQYRGLADPDTDTLVVRGDLQQRQFIAFWLRSGRVRAALNIDVGEHGDALQSLVEAQAAVTVAELTDGDLADLAARTPAGS